MPVSHIRGKSNEILTTTQMSSIIKAIKREYYERNKTYRPTGNSP